MGHRRLTREQEPNRQIDQLRKRVERLERRWITPGGGGAVYHIKVFEDDIDVIVGDDAFIFHIPPDLTDAVLVGASASISSAGGSDLQVQIRHGDACDTGVDVLTTKLTIDSGECYSGDSATAVVVADDTVMTGGDQLHIDVDQAAGTGLDVALVFALAEVAGIVIEGNQGPPGGVTQWMGAWQDATAYQEGQAVSHNGTSYVAIQDHTSNAANDEPGVGTNWEDFWQPLVVGHEPYSGITVMILGNGFILDSGVKAAIPIPFDCEIIEATLLANGAGDAVVDLWLDDYGSYPPTDADSITSATPLTLVAANKTTDTALSGWTTTLTAGDVLMVVIESVSDLQWLSVSLRVQRP